MTTPDFILTILLPAIGSGLLVTLGLVACSAPFGLLTGIGVSAILTLVEAFSHKGVDNFFVPVIAVISLQPLLPA